MDGEELRLKLHAHGMHAEYAHVCAIEPFGKQFDKGGLVFRKRIEKHFTKGYAVRTDVQYRVLNLQFLKITRRRKPDFHLS